MIRRVASLIAVGLVALALVAGFVRSADLQIAMSSEPSATDAYFHNFAGNNMLGCADGLALAEVRNAV